MGRLDLRRSHLREPLRWVPPSSGCGPGADPRAALQRRRCTRGGCGTATWSTGGAGSAGWSGGHWRRARSPAVRLCSPPTPATRPACGTGAARCVRGGRPSIRPALTPPGLHAGGVGRGIRQDADHAVLPIAIALGSRRARPAGEVEVTFDVRRPGTPCAGAGAHGAARRMCPQLFVRSSSTPLWRIPPRCARGRGTRQLRSASSWAEAPTGLGSGLGARGAAAHDEAALTACSAAACSLISDAGPRAWCGRAIPRRSIQGSPLHAGGKARSRRSVRGLGSLCQSRL